MDKQSPFAEDTKLKAAILTGPQGVEEGGEVCTLPSGEEVNFYQVIPCLLYTSELFAIRMTWELDNEEGLSCLFFELEAGYFTLSRKTGAEALRLEMNDPANGQLRCV